MNETYTKPTACHAEELIGKTSLGRCIPSIVLTKDAMSSGYAFYRECMDNDIAKRIRCRELLDTTASLLLRIPSQKEQEQDHVASA